MRGNRAWPILVSRRRKFHVKGGCRALISLYLCLQDMPRPLQPQFVLDVEMQELFIQAGHQDRVIQVNNKGIRATTMSCSSDFTHSHGEMSTIRAC